MNNRAFFKTKKTGWVLAMCVIVLFSVLALSTIALSEIDRDQPVSNDTSIGSVWLYNNGSWIANIKEGSTNKNSPTIITVSNSVSGSISIGANAKDAYGSASVSFPSVFNASQIPYNFSVTITASDGYTKQAYWYRVERAQPLSNDATIGSVTLFSRLMNIASTTQGALFSGSPTILTVPSTISGDIVIAATPKTNGASAVPSVSSFNTSSIPYNFNVTVTAPDGVSKLIYYYRVEREAAKSSDASIGSVILSNNGINIASTAVGSTNSGSPVVLTVANSISGTISIAVRSQANDGSAVSSVSSFNTSSLPYSFSVTVTAPDGVTKQTYYYRVDRSAPPVSNDASIGSVTLSNFGNTVDSTTAGSTSSASPTILTVANSISGTINISAATKASGSSASPSASSFNASSIPYSFSVTVTAPDGITKQTYYYRVNRAAANAVALANGINIRNGSATSSVSVVNATAAITSDSGAQTITIPASYAATTTFFAHVNLASGATLVSAAFAGGNVKITGGNVVTLPLPTYSMSLDLLLKFSVGGVIYEKTITIDRAPIVFESVKLNGVIVPPTTSDNRVYVKPGDVMEFSFVNAANVVIKVGIMRSDLYDVPGSRKTITLDANGKGKYIIPDNIDNSITYTIDVWTDYGFVIGASRHLTNTAAANIVTLANGVDIRSGPAAGSTLVVNSSTAITGDSAKVTMAIPAGHASTTTFYAHISLASGVTLSSASFGGSSAAVSGGNVVTLSLPANTMSRDLVLNFSAGGISYSKTITVTRATASSTAKVTEFSDIALLSLTEKNAIMKLAILGVLVGSEGPSGVFAFRPHDTMTRGEFAKLACVLTDNVKQAEQFASVGSKYSDVTVGNWYYGWVNAATAAGYFDSGQSGAFRPNANITMDEVVTTVMRMVGYDDNLGKSSGNTAQPANYVAKASELGLLDNVNFTGSAAATRAQIAVICSALLDVGMVVRADSGLIQGSTDPDGFAEVYYMSGTGAWVKETLLHKVFGCYSADRAVFVSAAGSVLQVKINNQTVPMKMAALYYISRNLTPADLPGQEAAIIYNNELVFVDVRGNTSPAQPQLPPTGFSDVPTDHWAYESVMLLVNKGVISGYPDGSFKPSGLVTRSEFAKMMTLTLGMPLLTDPAPSFVDVSKNDWEFIYVETGKKYLTGYQQGDNFYFKGKEAAVREDMAVALVKALKLENEPADLEELKNIFSDWATITPNLQKHVLIAFKNGLISGYPDGTFGAQKSITRAETAALLVKVLNSEAMKKVTFD